MKQISSSIITIVCLIVSGCHDTNINDLDTTELKSYEILFCRNDTSYDATGGSFGRSIYQINADGSNLRDLSKHEVAVAHRGFDNFPKYSPDGKYIAFRTTRDGAEEIYRMNNDGSNKINLTRYEGFDLEFDWSPDGASLVFRRLVNNRYVLCTMTNDGAGCTQITGPEHDSRFPVWSPDGTQIAFSRKAGTWRTVVVTPDGLNQRILSDTLNDALYPRWSPDSRIVYYKVTNAGLEAKSIDSQQRYFLSKCYPDNMSWSVDGTSFLTHDSLGIKSIRRDLTGETRLSVNGFYPAWSPDGKWIIYLREVKQYVSEIWVMRSNGSDQRRVTASTYGEILPSWKPTK
ncbi:MAG: hypothetical protein V1799_17030 [bacterium]